MKFIKQEQSHGCLIACIAMVMNWGYWDVAQFFVNDFTKSGVPLHKGATFLAENGYSIVSKETPHKCHRDFARDWMMEPFAPNHIIEFFQFTDTPKESHVVVMDAKGKIFDPGGHTAEDIIKGMYDLSRVIGIYEDKKLVRKKLD